METHVGTPRGVPLKARLGRIREARYMYICVLSLVCSVLIRFSEVFARMKGVFRAEA